MADDDDPWRKLAGKYHDDERARWGDDPPLYTGGAEVFSDLHPEQSGLQRWVKDGRGRGYWPDCCDKHRPPEIIESRRAAAAETRKREQAERDLAAHRHPAYHPAEAEPEPEPSPGRFAFLRRRRP